MVYQVCSNNDPRLTFASLCICMGIIFKNHFLNMYERLIAETYKVLLYPRHTKYVGVYSFRFFVRLFVCSFVCTYVRSFVRSFVFPSQGQSFCVKVYKTSYFEDPLMDFVRIWHDGRYRSKVFISTIPTPG